VDKIWSQYSEVSKKTKELYELCEGLMLEERQLRLFGEELRAHLKQWETFEVSSHQLASPSLSPQDAHFLPLLSKIDGCIAFFESHPNIRDAETYRLKLRQMQNRALTLINHFILAYFKHLQSLNSLAPQISAQIQAKPAVVPNGGTAKPVTLPVLSIEELEKQVSLKNAQFKSNVHMIRPLCQEVQTRASAREYALLFNDIVNGYFQLRRNTLQNLVVQHTQRLVAHQDMFKMLREGMIFFAKLCEDEYRQCQSLFHLPTSTQQEEEHATNDTHNIILTQLRSLLESFFSLLNDHLRPAILRTKDVSFLCSFIDILQYETIDSLIERDPEALAALHPIALRLMEDIKDRLIFISDIYIRDEIADFMPTEADLDYPKLLQALFVSRASSSISSSSVSDKSPQGTLLSISSSPTTHSKDEKLASDATVVSGSASSSTDVISSDMSGNEDEELPKLQVRGDGWYPTLERTLNLLAKLYVAIDLQSFSGIAQEAVLTCFQSLCSASKRVEAMHGKLEGQLFLIKNLGLLQENLLPFDIDYFVTETKLDFGHTRELLRRLLAGQLNFSSLFALSSNNTIFTLLQSAAPRFTKSERDLAKTMDDVLKQTMEAFIFSTTHQTFSTLLDYLAKVRKETQVAADAREKATANVEGVPQGSTSNRKDPGSTAANVALLKETYSTAIANLKGTLPRILSHLVLYLGNQSNHASLLFSSIKANLLDTLEAFYQHVEKEFGEEGVVLEPPFSLQQASAFIDQTFSKGYVPE